MATAPGWPGAGIPYCPVAETSARDIRMVPHDTILVALIRLIDLVPEPPTPPPGRGRPRLDPERLCLKALVVMLVRRLPSVHLFLAVLEQPTPEMRHLRTLLAPDGRWPVRRT